MRFRRLVRRLEAASRAWLRRFAQPPILFLDEPTSGVDPMSRRRFWDLINTLAAGGRVRGHHDPLHGRGGILQSNRSDQSRQARGPRQSKRTQAQRHRRRDPARRRRRLGATLEALEAAPAVLDVAPFGNSLHIVVDDAARDTPAIEAAFWARGLSCRGSNRSSRRSKTYSCSSSAATRAGARAMNFRRIRAIAKKEISRSCATRAA